MIEIVTKMTVVTAFCNYCSFCATIKIIVLRQSQWPPLRKKVKKKPLERRCEDECRMLSY